MANVFGNTIKLSVFGESHSEAIGVVLDGLPAGLRIDTEEIQAEMERRAPGRSRFSTPRHEGDVPRILSGCFNGKTTGTPLCAIIENTNTRSQDYHRWILRPSHADFAALFRYHGYEDYRGGGHFSGRLTAPLVFAGAVLKPYLAAEGVEIFAHMKTLGTQEDVPFDTVNPDLELYRTIKSRELPVLDEGVIPAFSQQIDAARQEGDSVGGIIECMLTGVAPGLGSPFFESVESRLAAMLFSVPAVKGVEFGAGFGITRLRGSEANDAFCFDDDMEIVTETNRNGGINGGITNGMPVCFSVAVKPTPSIAKPQKTVNMEAEQEEMVSVTGRHDPCILPRAVCVIEAAAAIVAADLILEGKSYAEPAPKGN